MTDDEILKRIAEYTEGVCEDGAVIFEDGRPMKVGQILSALREKDEKIERLREANKTLNDMAEARLSSAMAQSQQAKSATYEATQEGRIRELHWLTDELAKGEGDE